MHLKDMEWTDKHDITLGREVLVMYPYQYPYRSKERGDVWNNIAINLNGLDHPRFKFSKRSVRDRLTLLITKYKAKIRKEENASGISCEETELDQALEEIIDKEKLADEKCSEAKNKEKEEKTAAEEHRKAAMERLSQTKKRNAEGETSGVHAKKSRRSSSDVVEYLKQKQELESDHRKEEMQLRREELEASVEQQRHQNDMMKKFMEQQHQQTQMLLSLLVQKK
ncbi:capping protein inhibiting regulator of actin dynamics-like [Acropora millepora]|uniref:capping protein inhibiting regulator of actin dynamics-like n=1 Tax=Acropora millepora TaxID=45264 RepID=UPI001CF5ED52|nr:capping protein inhibiting regulator of actin dynamics-like [Acropora millepora]